VTRVAIEEAVAVEEAVVFKTVAKESQVSKP
jgi:hypothetical protein